jgi:16S rRNA (cytosine1402-N4)-methyltransferase
MPRTPANADDSPSSHRRRRRYSGTHPKRFDERYKELDPLAFPDMREHIRAQGRTPAGTHVPIMVAEVIEHLDPRPGQTVADCTLGYGGHAESLLRRIAPDGRLVGFDVDGEQLERTRQRLAALELGATLLPHRMNFAGIAKAMAREGVEGFDVVFADLGVSSMQLDDPARGFSYKHDGPLDMRMDSRITRSAADLLAGIDEADLSAALTDLADEEEAAVIAAAIVRRRRQRPITTTLDLVQAVLDARGLTHRDWKRLKADDASATHPAAKTFQALRILVNDELGSLKALLRLAPWCLRPLGRIGILTFHSGEDRLIKHAFRDGARDGTYEAAADEPLRPSPAETASNPRSRAAKFRWARRASG